MTLVSGRTIVFSAVIVAWCILAILPIYVDENSETFKVLTTILGSVPLVLVSYRMITIYIIPLFMFDFGDPQTTNLPSFLLMIITWIFSWADIYTIFWVWNRAYCVDPLLAATNDAYDAFRFMLGGSIGVYVSDSTIHTSFTRSWIVILVGAQGIISFMFTIYVSALIIPAVFEFFKSVSETPRPKSHASKKISRLDNVLEIPMRLFAHEN